MHVLLLTYEFHPTIGGVGNATLALAKALRDHRGDRVTVVVCRSWWPSEERVLHEVWDGFDVYRIAYTGIPEERPFRQTVRSLLCFLHVFVRIRKLFPDVIIAQRLYDLGWFAGMIGRILQIPSFAYAHGPDDTQHAERRPLRLRLTRWAFGLNRCVFVTNTFFRELLRRIDHTTAIEIVPNIAPHTPRAVAPRALHSAHDGKFHVACIGRMVVEFGIETKGFSHAIRSLPDLPDTVLHLFGDGAYRPDLERIAAETGVASRVLFHGALGRDALHGELLRMDLLLHPATIEGLPMIVIEAMSLGVPVMATEVGGIPDIVKDGDTGFLIRPEDSRDISQKIMTVRANGELLESVASRAKDFIRIHASGEHIAGLLHTHIRTYTGV